MPPELVIWIVAEAEAAAVAGIVKVSEVPDSLIDNPELATVTVPTFTVAPAKNSPVTVTVPTPRLVPVCETFVTAGKFVNTFIDLLSEPPAVVSTSDCAPSGAVAGIVTVAEVAVAPADNVAATPPTVTVGLPKFVPVIRTVKPRFCDATLSEVILGAKGTIVTFWLTVPPAVVTLTVLFPTTAVSGTVITNCEALAPGLTTATTVPTFAVTAAADGLALGFARYEPLIVSSLPTTTELLPSEVILGAATTVKALDVEPPSAVTPTELSPTAELTDAPAGTTIFADVAVAVKLGAGLATTPPIVKEVPVRFVPETVTTVPAFATAGVKAEIVGAW